MATLLLPERLSGEYNGVTPPPLLPIGGISGGSNIRKVSQAGGWKPRKGCTLHNTTVVETGASIKSLHYYSKLVLLHKALFLPLRQKDDGASQKLKYYSMMNR